LSVTEGIVGQLNKALGRQWFHPTDFGGARRAQGRRERRDDQAADPTTGPANYYRAPRDVAPDAEEFILSAEGAGTMDMVSPPASRRPVPQRRHLRTMGSAPAGVAACVAQPGRPVIHLRVPAATLFRHGDAETLVRYASRSRSSS
jgi:thiamine pyrophosphate-dependent acetolactate synthase large subunit-like protein